MLFNHILYRVTQFTSNTVQSNNGEGGRIDRQNLSGKWDGTVKVVRLQRGLETEKDTEATNGTPEDEYHRYLL